MNKTTLTTHESFSLSRPSLSQLLKLASAQGGKSTKKLSFDGIHQQTSLGTNQVKSTRIYAKDTGLLNEQEQVTEFGGLTYSHDPGLSKTITQWILHYHMAAPHRNGPSYWGTISTNLFHTDAVLKSKSVAAEIKQVHLSGSDKVLSEDTYVRAATEFLGTYAKWDGLGELNVLTEPDKGEYTVGDPAPPPWGVAAYALADYWEGNWGDRTGVNLDSVRDVAALLLVGGGEMNAFLRTMQEHELVDVQRRHPPYQVTRQFSSAEAVLERLYDAEDL